MTQRNGAGKKAQPTLRPWRRCMEFGFNSPDQIFIYATTCSTRFFVARQAGKSSEFVAVQRHEGSPFDLGFLVRMSIWPVRLAAPLNRANQLREWSEAFALPRWICH